MENEFEKAISQFRYAWAIGCILLQINMFQQKGKVNDSFLFYLFIIIVLGGGGCWGLHHNIYFAIIWSFNAYFVWNAAQIISQLGP